MSVAPYDPVSEPKPPLSDEPPPADAPAGSDAPPARDRRPIVMEAVVCLAVAVIIAGLGAPIGLLWRALAPKVELVQTAYGPYPVDGEPEGYVADEGWFIFIAFGVGVVLALLVWYGLRRFRGAMMLGALVVGSIGGSVLAAWLGHRIGLARYERLINQAPAGAHIFRPVRLRLADVGLYFGFIPRVRGVVLVQALVAAALYTAFAGFSYSPSLRPEKPGPPQPGQASPPELATQPEPDQGGRAGEPAHPDEVGAVSWGWAEPQDPPAAPVRPAPAATVQPLDVTWRARPEGD